MTVFLSPSRQISHYDRFLNMQFIINLLYHYYYFLLLFILLLFIIVIINLLFDDA
jgi:hypothetical protein